MHQIMPKSKWCLRIFSLTNNQTKIDTLLNKLTAFNVDEARKLLALLTDTKSKREAARKMIAAWP